MELKKKKKHFKVNKEKFFFPGIVAKYSPTNFFFVSHYR